MKKITNLILLLLILVLVLVTWFFLYPSFRQIIRIRQAIKQEHQTLAQLTTKLDQLSSLSEADLVQKNDQLIKALPIEKQIPEILLTVKNLANQAGLIMSNLDLTPGSLATESGQPSLPISFQLDGSPDQLKNFVNQMKTSLPLMTISEINLTNTDNIYSSQLEVLTYYLPALNQLGPVEASMNEISAQEENIYQQIAGYSTVIPKIEFTPGSSGKANPFTP